MIRLVEALNFRCLRYIRQPLERFQVLVGPNASGKTTFLDVVSFLGRLVSDGPKAAVETLSLDFRDLVWGRSGDWFELAIEATIPDEKRQLLPADFGTIRYEVRIGILGEGEGVGILAENVLLKNGAIRAPQPRALFPADVDPVDTLLIARATKGTRRVLGKAAGGNDNYYSEVKEESGKGWFPSIRLGPRKSAFGNLPADESKFPVSIWLKELLTEGIQTLVLNSLLIRKASPPGQVRKFKPDGSNLPWVIAELRRSEDRYRSWIAHLRTALPDLIGVETVERPDDKHRYLVLEYQGGLRVPSWVASDGTLRLLALTLPAYLPDFKGVYLIEEPENGIHPRAIETLFQSLSSTYEAQILVATHSPVILGSADLAQVLCFKKTDHGATDIVRGDEHPSLREWRGETSLGGLFAAGVLG
jgi:hypothetical protein